MTTWLRRFFGSFHDPQTIASGVVNLILVGGFIGLGLKAVPLLQAPWAQFYSIQAEWLPNGGHDPRLHISFQLYKNEECREVQVRKHLSRVVQEGDVTAANIPLNGQLPSKLRDAQIGTSLISDDSRPRAPVPPGQYQLVMLASCVPVEPASTQSKAADAARAPVLKDAEIVQVNITVGHPRGTRTGYMLGAMEWP